MIFNRTQTDVEDALRVRDEKVKKNLQLTQDDLDAIEKGFFTLNGVNRIEGKQKQLTDALNRMGYYNIGSPSDNKSDWNDTDIFRFDDLERIVRKTNDLRDGFFRLSFFPPQVMIGTRFEDLNDLEKTLHDIESTIDDVESRYKICGAAHARE